jgi:hypothetical protein
MSATQTMNRSVTGVHDRAQEIFGYYPSTSPMAAVIAETTDFVSLFYEGVTDEDALDDAKTRLGLVIAMSGLSPARVERVRAMVSGYVFIAMRRVIDSDTFARAIELLSSPRYYDVS